MANGKFADGDGTVNNPFLIEDAFDLDAVRNNLSANYKLINDIDLNIEPFNQDKGWKCIGDYNNYFKGILDGNGYCIKNLYIHGNIAHASLFAFGGCSIKNLYMKDVDIYTTHTDGNAGALFSDTAYDIEINNVIVSGRIQSMLRAGGIAGRFMGVGQISNICIKCEIKGLGTESQIGGLLGNASGNEVFKNIYSVSKISSLGQYTGGLVGYYPHEKNSFNCFYNKNISGQNDSKLGLPKTTEEMKTPSTFVDWDKERLEDGISVWILQDGQYPKLWFEKELYKFLIKQNNRYYTIQSEHYQDGQFQPVTLEGGLIPNNNDFVNNGFDDLSLLTQNMTIGTETLKPIDKLKTINDGKFDIVMKEIE